MAFIRVSGRELAENYEKLCRLVAPAQVLPFIKGDGYGIGTRFEVETLYAAGARAFCCARPEEALKVKELAPEAQVRMCSVVTQPQLLSRLIGAGISVTVESAQTLRQVSSLSEGVCDVNLAIETGMGRFGMTEDKLDEFCEEYNRVKNIHIVSTFTHFANCYGGKKCEKATRAQFATFIKAVERLRAGGVDCGQLHAANSAAALLYPDLRADAVRVGSALLGRSIGSREAGLTKVGTVSAEVLTVKTVKKGQSIGYGGVFTARRDMRVAVVDCGHCDGVFVTRRRDGFRLRDCLSAVRHDLSQKPLCAVLNGHTVRVLGRVGMTNTVLCAEGVECEAGDIAEFDFNPIFCASKVIAYE